MSINLPKFFKSDENSPPTMVLPLLIFFVAQRVFIQGIVITGVDK